MILEKRCREEDGGGEKGCIYEGTEIGKEVQV
jgi:hypothetical protein